MGYDDEPDDATVNDERCDVSASRERRKLDSNVPTDTLYIDIVFLKSSSQSRSRLLIIILYCGYT